MSTDFLKALKDDLKEKENEYKTKQMSLNDVNALKEEIKTNKNLIKFYKYYNEIRRILPTDLIPDENRTAVIPPKDFAIKAAEFKELADKTLSNLYDYIIHLSLTKHLFPFLKQSNLICLDAGCSIGGISFRLSQQKDIKKVYGIDLSPSFIEYAKQKKQKLSKHNGNMSKLDFLCQDASVLSQFKCNEIDIGFCSLVLHEMPRRVPMNVLCELSRVCKYMVVLDWIGPNYPWNKAGIRNRRIEYQAGPGHFNGFLHFVKLGGIEAHIQSLQRHRKNVKIRLFKKIDQGTMGLYILDTTKTKQVQMDSKL